MSKITEIKGKKNYAYFLIVLLSMLSNIVALFFQYAFQDHPCTLCLLQRFGFVCIGFGALQAMIHGRNFICDALIALSSLFTMCVGLRQVLLHVTPGDPGFGSTFLNLHMYTWSAIISFCLIFFMFIIPIFGKIRIKSQQLKHMFVKAPKILDAIFIFICVLNLITVYYQCEFGPCQDDGLTLKQAMQNTMKDVGDVIEKI